MSIRITVVGGAKSGKTDFIFNVCESLEDVVWWGTAVEIPHDPEWKSRLDSLRSARKSSWRTLDGPTALPDSSVADLHLKDSSVFVFDSLNLWLAAQMQQALTRYSFSQLKTHLEIEFRQLCKLLGQLPCTVLIVTAEAGSGVVPSGEAGRLFRELLGQWNQEVVAHSNYGVTLQCGQAFLWPAGLMPISDAGEPVRRVNTLHVRRLLSQV